MAEVTVKQLADTVGRTVEILLAQMREAGLSHQGAGDHVSDAEKQQLLAHLKRAHGEQAGEPKKITLQRKTVSTLKTSPAVGGKAKTVNVEVRKTRTYVKRSLLEEQEDKQREAEEAVRRAAEDARVAAAEEEARKAAEEARRQMGEQPKDARKLSVPKVDIKKNETPEERARREEEAARERAADDARRKQEDAHRREA